MIWDTFKKGICEDFENFVNVLWILSSIHVHLICERYFEIGFKLVFKCFEYSSFDFSAQIFLLKRFRKKKNKNKNKTKQKTSGNSVTTKWFSYSLVKHERCCHFSIEGDRTRLSLWRHALFWMGAFGRRSLTRNSSVFRMPLKNLS